jgi:hypothetical protein
MNFTRENAIDHILQAVPGFRPHWEAHLEFWGEDSVGITMDMIEFAVYTNRLFENNAETELAVIFELTESMLWEGTQEIMDAVATGFLESILNPLTESSTHLPLLNQLLGRRSRAYSQAWLSFSGADLPGI